MKVRDTPDGTAAGTRTHKRGNSVTHNLKIVVRKRRNFVLAFWFFVNGGICFSFSGLWAGPYFEQVCGWSPKEAGMLISLFGLGIVVGPLLGSLASRTLRHAPTLLALSMLLLAASLVCLGATGGSMSYAAAGLWCVAFTAIMAAPFGVVFALAQEGIPADAAGMASGFVYTFCTVGAASMQGLVGLWLRGSPHAVLRHSDFTPVFAVYVALSLVAAWRCRWMRTSPSSSPDTLVPRTS